MAKKLNIDAMRTELAESAFFRDYKKPADSPPPPVADIPAVIEQKTPILQAKPIIPERTNARTPVRSNAKRIITRNSFEIYEDQMDSLRELAYLEKREGRIGSMSAMVREAIDTYLKENAKTE